MTKPFVVNDSATHKLLLYSTWCFSTANFWASNKTSFTWRAPFLFTNVNCLMASSIDIPLIMDATYHILKGLYLMLAL